jgi:Rrf2 family transcriptional regulator, cysteine metabolism repressor
MIIRQDMRYSTKTEYGLKALVNLAKIYPRVKSLKVLAKEESLPIKYLERIMNNLKKDDLVVSRLGKKGGYALADQPSNINLSAIVISLEGSISPMKCVGSDCHLRSDCSLTAFWDKLGKETERQLKSIRLSEIATVNSSI